MYRAALILTLSSCALLAMLGVVVLRAAWVGEYNTLVLPGATDVQAHQLSLSHQQLTYHVPPHQTSNDVLDKLTSAGWIRDTQAERALRRDGMDEADVLAVFWRHGWFGLVPEIATIRGDPHDPRWVKIEIVRCVTFAPWMHCIQ